MTFVGRSYLQIREPHPDDVLGVGKTVPVDPPRVVVAVAGRWGKNIAVRWPCGRIVVRPSRGLKKVTNHKEKP